MEMESLMMSVESGTMAQTPISNKEHKVDENTAALAERDLLILLHSW